MSTPAAGAVGVAAEIDAEEAVELLLRDLRSSRAGLCSREAQRRLVQYGPNALSRRGGLRWPQELARQFTHPLALLLWAAALLAWLVGIHAVAIAIVVVIVVNAIFAFVQEAQAERAVEALAAFLPEQAKVIRDGRTVATAASELVPGDVLVLEEGDRVSADARLLTGAVEVDLSMLTGESAPVLRSAELLDAHVPLDRARDLVLSGTSCTEGEARALVFATGMRTELGRIAALSERVEAEESPLEMQVRRVAWLIAAIAVTLGIAFMPIAILGAGLPFKDAVVFAVGLLVGNVPEGLLPVITLALAVGVRGLVRDGAVVKRLSAVETLGSTDVICTDKTGTLTENRMRATSIWTIGAEHPLDPEHESHATDRADARLAALAEAMAACNNAELDGDGQPTGDPTEIALLQAAASLGVAFSKRERAALRRREFRFDPTLKLMSTVDELPDGLWLDAKGAPEAILERCTTTLGPDGEEHRLSDAEREAAGGTVERYAGEGLRVLALARRRLEAGAELPARREQAERELCLLGLAALIDPPRPEVAAAVQSCHAAGIRVIVITGDHGLTAAAVARQVGIGAGASAIVTGEQLDRMSDEQLDRVLDGDRELIFARSSPEAKLRIADALRASGHVVAMTGDGVNDAPALRRADIGIAMGRSGTDVAREAATMILTDDNFATIAAAVQAGRRVYDNIRKFILYIFAHATPEVTPFLVYALSGGAIPLPLTVLQLLAFDVGTETLPALALGREPAEPGLMERPPRPRSESVIQTPMLLRAWLFLGVISAALEMGGFFFVLLKGGWSLGAATGNGHALHHVYREATTMTFFSMVACQVGTAFAARTERASLRSVGVFSNPLLLWGIAFELALAAAIIYLPPLQSLLGTAALGPDALALTLPFPFVVWGADELRRLLIRRRERSGEPAATARGARETSEVGGCGLIAAQFSATGVGAVTAERGTVRTMAAEAEKGGEASDAVRIVLADDHQVVRSGLRLLLENEQGFEVVAEASDVESAARYVRGHHPDVLVLDLNMPGGSSLEAIPQIREQSPETQIVVLTMQQEPAFAREALGAGALGYVLKEAADDELVEAVRNAAVGESYLNPRLGARIASEPPPGPPDDLSEREVEVLRLIALGHTNAEIAEQLFLSVRTVETHRSHIQQKLRLSTRAELVRYALERGLIDAGG